jgi:hypothetical protein
VVRLHLSPGVDNVLGQQVIYRDQAVPVRRPFEIDEIPQGIFGQMHAVNKREINRTAEKFLGILPGKIIVARYAEEPSWSAQRMPNLKLWINTNRWCARKAETFSVLAANFAIIGGLYDVLCTRPSPCFSALIAILTTLQRLDTLVPRRP